MLVDEAGAEELAIDANSTGPVEPSRGAVLAAVVVDAVVVTANRRSVDDVHAEPIRLSHASDSGLKNYREDKRLTKPCVIISYHFFPPTSQFASKGQRGSLAGARSQCCCGCTSGCC